MILRQPLALEGVFVLVLHAHSHLPSANCAEIYLDWDGQAVENAYYTSCNYLWIFTAWLEKKGWSIIHPFLRLSCSLLMDCV